MEYNVCSILCRLGDSGGGYLNGGCGCYVYPQMLFPSSRLYQNLDSENAHERFRLRSRQESE